MIYLDNAATSFPKPLPVMERVIAAIVNGLGNPGRSSHPLSRAAAEEVFGAREAIAALIGLSSPENVVFTSGATAALNLAILGTVCALEKRVFRPLVVTSPLEHNSVLRPLFRLENMGRIRLRILPLNEKAEPDDSLLSSLRPHLLVLSSRSNVTGITPNLKRIASFTKESGTVYIADVAQALGTGEFRFPEIGADILCAPGHKGLYGMMGGGFLAVNETSPVLPEAILSGGSGNDSFNPSMPEYLPERLEAGTLPLPAIVSMRAGADFLQKIGCDRIRAHEKRLKRLLVEGISTMPEYTLYHPWAELGPVLLNHRRKDSQHVAQRLEEEGIFARAGFHCAPLAHRALGTEARGALRLSPGFFTREEEIYQTLRSLEKIGKEIG